MGKTPPITPNMALNKMMGKIDAPMMYAQTFLMILLHKYKKGTQSLFTDAASGTVCLHVDLSQPSRPNLM